MLWCFAPCEMLSALLLLWLVTNASSITPGLKKPDNARNKVYKWDENGYVLYCPCMGRFGNQAAHFLGSLAFAKALNRTLVIPPWRSYQYQRNVPYTEFFRLDSILLYHRALLLEDFIDQLAPSHWAPGNRTGYCYGPSSRVTDREDCDMKYGNPFGPFWDEFSVTFDESEFTQMSYTINREVVLSRWKERYPASSHPVMAFKGAPASFPMLPDHRFLHKYMRWNPRMEEEAFQFINNSFGTGTNFIAVHLRMGVDWERACKSAVGQQKFMESVQCLESMPSVLITQSLCLPSMEDVKQYLLALTRKIRIYTVFVASDVPAENHGLQQRLGGRIKTYYLPPDFPQLDLAIMAKAQHFVGNCISSFSAFVKRERDFLQRHSDFFGLAEIKESYESNKKTEL